MSHAAGAPDRRSFGLDLMRCAAVLLVVQAHGLAMASSFYGFELPVACGLGGLLGVDLFFGLSGFLIGGLLLRIAQDRPTLRDWRVFMVRRWMRTVPLYAVWLAVLLLLQPPPEGLAVFGRYLAFAQNLAWPMPGSHWFAVSWSLAVEEWFYLTFSAVFLLLARLCGARPAAWGAIALFIAVPVILRARVASVDDYTDAVLHVVLTRLDAIAYGVAFAALWAARSRLFRLPWLCGAAGVLLLWLFWGPKVAVWFQLAAVPFIDLSLVADGIGVCLVLAALTALPHAPRWLTVPVRGLSNMSYALYLTHLTFFDRIAYWGTVHGVGRGVILAAMLLAAGGFSLLSWRYFEQPILARRPAQRSFAPVLQAA